MHLGHGGALRGVVEAGETIRFAVSQKGDLGLEDVRFESADITFYFQTTTTTSTTILDLEAQTRRCDTDESFRTDFGEFTLIGVSPLAQARTCVAGQRCTTSTAPASRAGSAPLTASPSRASSTATTSWC